MFPVLAWIAGIIIHVGSHPMIKEKNELFFFKFMTPWSFVVSNNNKAKGNPKL
jgi:hypothetical protein